MKNKRNLFSFDGLLEEKMMTFDTQKFLKSKNIQQPKVPFVKDIHQGHMEPILGKVL